LGGIAAGDEIGLKGIRIAVGDKICGTR